MRPPWKIRRRVVLAVLAVCAVAVLRFTFLPTAGVDPELAKMIVLGAYGLAGTTTGAYVFGAAWDDRNVMKLIGKDAYALEPPAWPKDIVMPEPAHGQDDAAYDAPNPPPPYEYRNAP